MDVNTAIEKHQTDLFYRYLLGILKETGQLVVVIVVIIAPEVAAVSHR